MPYRLRLSGRSWGTTLACLSEFCKYSQTRSNQPIFSHQAIEVSVVLIAVVNFSNKNCTHRMSGPFRSSLTNFSPCRTVLTAINN